MRTAPQTGVLSQSPGEGDPKRLPGDPPHGACGEPEVWKKSILYGAVCFLTKESIEELPSFLQRSFRESAAPCGEGSSAEWRKLFEKIASAKEGKGCLPEEVHRITGGEARKIPREGRPHSEHLESPSRRFGSFIASGMAG